VAQAIDSQVKEALEMAQATDNQVKNVLENEQRSIIPPFSREYSLKSRDTLTMVTF
jgi:hypothetical protein